MESGDRESERASVSFAFAGAGAIWYIAPARCRWRVRLQDRCEIISLFLR
jgi:hypothetical protein